MHAFITRWATEWAILQKKRDYKQKSSKDLDNIQISNMQIASISIVENSELLINQLF